MITKLVRDLMPEICKKNNFVSTFYVADQTEYADRLKDKLIEETQEYITDNTVEELADIMEVVHALATYHGISIEQLEKVRQEKAHTRGAFTKRLIIQFQK